VTGFNNSIEERLATPPLTTVDLPFEQQGARSVDMLLAQINGESVPALLTLPSSLVVRQSCGCAPLAEREAAYIPEPGTGGFELVLNRLRNTPEREACLSDMARETGGKLQDISIRIEPVLDALLADLEQFYPEKPNNKHFLQKLDDALNQAMLSGEDLSLWNNLISVQRRWVLPGLGLTERSALEAIFSQARVVISEAELRSHSYWQWQAERQSEALRATNHALLTTFNIHQLGDVLHEHLTGLGIPSAYLVIYEKPSNPLDFSRLMLAYADQDRFAIDPAGWRFPTRQLVPPEFLPHDRRYSLVVEPLYFQDKPLGYAVFENGPRDGDIYELVRANLSSAIQGALLFDEIQQARLAAEKADRIKSRLLANVSHELRTPLNIILGTTQSLLKSQSDDQELGRNIQSIQDHAEHQLRVINHLLDLSRAEIDELDLALELIDPRPFLSEAFRAIADQNNNPDLEWKLELPERLPLVRADGVRLRLILLNLLSNAGKFTDRGRVELGAEVIPPHLHFCQTTNVTLTFVYV
jgi:signal transduction histidine kinase